MTATTTTTTFVLQPNQVHLRDIMSGWKTWSVRRRDGSVLITNVTREDGGDWSVAESTDLGSPPEYVTSVKTLAEAKVVLAALFNRTDPAQALAEHKPVRRKAAAALSPVEEGVKVGDFYYASWGYDQTNIDFYEVVGLTPKGVKVRKVGAQVVEDHTSQEAVVPVAGAYLDNKPETKVLRPCGRPGGALSFSSYKSAWLWDGTPKYRTASGWGH